jgi:hypothetical protein
MLIIIYYSWSRKLRNGREDKEDGTNILKMGWKSQKYKDID